MRVWHIGDFFSPTVGIKKEMVYFKIDKDFRTLQLFVLVFFMDIGQVRSLWVGILEPPAWI